LVVIVTDGNAIRDAWQVEDLPGFAAAGRNYVEADRARADDYYLAESGGYAELYRATRNGPDAAIAVHRVRAMDGDTYERWVAGVDIATGAPKGRLRTDDQAVRFGEIAVNGQAPPPANSSESSTSTPDATTNPNNRAEITTAEPTIRRFSCPVCPETSHGAPGSVLAQHIGMGCLKTSA
jgi:hypothetical protein